MNLFTSGSCGWNPALWQKIIIIKPASQTWNLTTPAFNHEVVHIHEHVCQGCLWRATVGMWRENNGIGLKVHLNNWLQKKPTRIYHTHVPCLSVPLIRQWRSWRYLLLSLNRAQSTTTSHIMKENISSKCICSLDQKRNCNRFSELYLTKQLYLTAGMTTYLTEVWDPPLLMEEAPAQKKQN